MNGYSEAKCPCGNEFKWLTGTPFVCPVCKRPMRHPYPIFLRSSKVVNALTRREIDVVALVGEGRTNKEIAGELVIEECTVEHHLHSVFRKLGFKTRTQVAKFAWDHGITYIKPTQQNPNNPTDQPTPD